jgi:hypothetical protein
MFTTGGESSAEKQFETSNFETFEPKKEKHHVKFSKASAEQQKLAIENFAKQETRNLTAMVKKRDSDLKA